MTEERCLICGGELSWEHDHRPDMSGLDDGPKAAHEISAIRKRAWATRRQKYGKYGHR